MLGIREYAMSAFSSIPVLAFK
jgi:hypothetical protein